MSLISEALKKARATAALHEDSRDVLPDHVSLQQHMPDPPTRSTALPATIAGIGLLCVFAIGAMFVPWQPEQTRAYQGPTEEAIWDSLHSGRSSVEFALTPDAADQSGELQHAVAERIDALATEQTLKPLKTRDIPAATDLDEATRLHMRRRYANAKAASAGSDRSQADATSTSDKGAAADPSDGMADDDIAANTKRENVADDRNTGSTDTSASHSKARDDTQTSNDKAADSKPRHPLANRSYLRQLSIDGGPTLRLDGIAWSMHSPAAIINNTLVMAGEEVDGVTVIEVSPKRVKLRHRSTVFYLRMP